MGRFILNFTRLHIIKVLHILLKKTIESYMAMRKTFIIRMY